MRMKMGCVSLIPNIGNLRATSFSMAFILTTPVAVSLLPPQCLWKQITGNGNNKGMRVPGFGPGLVAWEATVIPGYTTLALLS